jgi:hypothetical protein
VLSSGIIPASPLRCVFEKFPEAWHRELSLLTLYDAFFEGFPKGCHRNRAGNRKSDADFA